jgi:hypothetical protein
LADSQRRAAVFGRTAGTAAWIWQILDDLQQTLDAGVTGDTEQQKSAMTDLLLTLAMVLAHHASTRNWAHDRTERAPAPLADTVSRPSTHTPVTIVQQADVLGEHPVQHRSSLHTDTALNLAKTLDRFAVTRPASLVPGQRNRPAYLSLPSRHPLLRTSG